jgi:kinetochore protein Nuf2
MIRQQARPLYSFPELKSIEILQCMADLNIPLAENELLKPTAPIVQKIYESFTEIFMGCSREQYVVNESSMEITSLEYSEIYLDSISLVKFFKIIARLMFEVGIEDFGMKDLIKPDPTRFRIILSAIINFAKFREEQLGIYEGLTKRTEEILAEKENLLNKFQDLTNKLAAWRRQRQDEEPQYLKIKESNNQLIQELKDLKKEQSNLTTNIEELKAKRTDFNEKMVSI